MVIPFVNFKSEKSKSEAYHKTVAKIQIMYSVFVLEKFFQFTTLINHFKFRSNTLPTSLYGDILIMKNKNDENAIHAKTAFHHIYERHK
jgi:hypothetical protein